MYSLDDITHVIVDHLGSEGAKPVLDTLKTVMLEVEKVPPIMNEGKTWGDWALSVPYVHEEIRPFTTLSYQIIDTMLRTGIIRFAVDLKRAKMVSGFRNERSLQVHCSDKVLADAALAALSRMLPQMTYEMSWSALVYGSAFMETVWGTMTGYELGISDRKTSELFSMPIQANLVPHKTIRAIKRGENGRFNGFVQNPAMHYHTHIMDQRTASLHGISHTDILVPAESALVVPYNGYSRNLWGESFLSPIYPLWFWYEIIMRCLVSYTQLMGDPPRLGKAPSKKKLQVTTTGQTIDAVDYMMAVGVNLSKSNTAVIPSDVDPETKTPQYELAYMQMPDRSQPFVNILEHLNQQILRAALSSDKTLISSPGGGAAIGEIHAEATALHDEMIVSSWLHFINKYFVKYISVYNRGTGGPPIWLELQGLDPREQALLQSVLGVAGNTKSFDDFFYSVDWRALGQLSGLPMLSEEEKDALKQKLNEEGLKQQADQQILSQQLAPPEQKQLQAKLDQLTETNPVVLSQDEIDKFHPIEETRKVFVVPKPKRDPKLAAAVVATMVLEGISDEDSPFGSIQLFNPYHDALGRFASKQGSAQLFGQTGTKEVSRGKVAQIVGSVSKEYGPLVKFETVTCGDWNCVKKNTGSSSKDILGAFSDGKLVLSPGIGAMTERVVRHETIHARKRSQGGSLVLRSPEHRRVEEGCTELMTFKKVRAGTPYAKEMMMVAKAARNYAGNDTKKAWDFIQKVHYHNDTDVGVSAVRKYGGKGTENDVWWLLDSVKLEITQDDTFAKSEDAIYRDIRKVENKRVVDVPLPEDF